jgi:hypothetical protein
VSIGRDGLLCDMPRNDKGEQITAADVNNGFRASIQEYKAESIIDWHESIINNVKVLDLLILCESIEVFVEGSVNQREMQNRYKVYRLNDDGVTVEIFTSKAGKDATGLESNGQVAILGPSDEKLTSIPFVFVGSKNNQPSIDNLPLEPITDINIGHYQESANLASSSFQLSACQPVVADDNYCRYSRELENQGKNVELGEDSMIVLGSGGRYDLVSPPENNLSKSIQEDYEQQMIALGAQLIVSSGGVETAEAARLKHASNVSDLEVISNNISMAYTKMIEWVCFFMGVEHKDEYTFSLNSEFFDTALSAEDAMKWVSVWQGAAITKDVLDSILVKGKAIGADVDLEAMNKEIDDNAPALGLDE